MMRPFLGLTLAALFLCAGANAQDLTLNTVNPDTGSFLGGTPVTLSGDFSITSNTAPVTSHRVFFSADDTLGGEDDFEAVVTTHSAASITVITPAVNAPGIFSVFVQATRGEATESSNSQPFDFTDEDESGVDAAARTLNDNFDFIAGGDNMISLVEAEAFGVSAAEFLELDANEDGQLTQDELQAFIDSNQNCRERLGDFLSGFSILGIFTFILSLLDWLRNGLFGPGLLS